MLHICNTYKMCEYQKLGTPSSVLSATIYYAYIYIYIHSCGGQSICSNYIYISLSSGSAPALSMTAELPEKQVPTVHLQ